jgi:NAD/NADP transhydrogenase alpha subunit
MILGIINESDNRVAIVPDVIDQLTGYGIDVQMVKDAGEKAGFPDSAYKDKKVKFVVISC